MTIKISIQTAGIPSFSAILKDEALPELFLLVQKTRDDVPSEITQSPTSHINSPQHLSLNPPTNSFVATNNDSTVKDWFKAYGAAELLNVFKTWHSFHEKILLLGALHEAKGGSSPWRSSDMDEIFKQAKEKPPANFPRDIKTAIQSGVIHANTPRTYSVTRTGWNKIAQAIELLGQ